MKILLIINSLTPGGAERQTIQDANILSAAGHRVTIAFQVEGSLIKFINEKVRLYQINSLNVLAASLQLNKHLKIEKYDFIFAHMFWAIKISAIPSVLCRSKLLFFEHGLGLWRRWYHLIILHLSAIPCIRIVTVSEAKKRIKIEREKFRTTDITVIPNSFTSSIRVINKKKSNSIFKICFTGRFNAVKQLEILPTLAEYLSKQYSDFIFILMGDGPEQKHINDLIYSKNLENYFQLKGYVSNPYIIMQYSDIFILPSKREDFSVALLEASSVELPCIAFDVGGNSEIIQNNKTGFVIPPFDIQMMADKIVYLIHNPNIKLAMGKAAKKFVENNFSEAKRLERLSSLISSIK